MPDDRYHAPVLVERVVSFLVTNPEGVYVDATLGGGGHAGAICSMLRGSGKLIGCDVDEDALRFASHRLEDFRGRVTLLRANFSELSVELAKIGIRQVQGILFDLGVSSFQLDEPTRGFSFQSDARIDMRMDRRLTLTGSGVVNTYGEKDLARVVRAYGEERNAGRIAKKLVQMRPFESTGQLRDAVESAVGKKFLTKTLARVFQAIRIEVNQELTHLAQGLEDALRVTHPGGRIAVISYHSLEDRIVKNFFRSHSSLSGTEMKPGSHLLNLLTRKPIAASASEVEQNPRARSAKLRVAERREDT